MSTINRLFIALLLVIGCAMAAATSALAQGKKQFDIPFAADTRDVHIQISTPIIGTSVSPAPNNEQMHGTNQISLGWNVPPGAGNRTVEVRRDGSGRWNLKYWLTTDGNVSTFPSTAPTKELAGLFIGVENGLVSLFGDNDTLSPVQVTNLAATLVLDLGTFFDASWSGATGSIISLSDAIIPAGADDFFLGSFALVLPRGSRSTATSTGNGTSLPKSPFPNRPLSRLSAPAFSACSGMVRYIAGGRRSEDLSCDG